VLRVQAGLAMQERADWWTRLQEVSPEEREQMTAALDAQTSRPPGPRRGTRGRRRPRNSGPA
jgi:hypothetical protein